MQDHSSLPTLVPIQLGGYSLDLDYFLKAAYDDIGAASEELPALIEWVNYQLQCLTEKMLSRKQGVKRAESAAFFNLKNGLFLERGYVGKVTDSSVERAVPLEESVIKAHEEYNVLYGWVRRLQSVQVSLQLKLDLVRSTESTRRRLVDHSELKQDSDEQP